MTDLNISASSGTIYTALSRLEKLELVDEERQRPYTRYIQLTGDGKAIAKYLKKIDDVLTAKKDRQSRQSPT